MGSSNWELKIKVLGWRVWDNILGDLGEVYLYREQKVNRLLTRSIPSLLGVGGRHILL